MGRKGQKSYQEKWKFSREERKKPLRSVHVALHSTLNEMVPKVWKLNFEKSVELVKPELKLLKAFAEHVSKAKVVHHLVDQQVTVCIRKKM